jgi:hypothetical protein
MKPSMEQIEKLEQALSLAHAVQDAPELSKSWVYGVMRDVRRQASSARTTMEVPRLMWRAATVVIFLSMVVVGSVLAWDAQRADAGFAGFFTETTLDLSLL